MASQVEGARNLNGKFFPLVFLRHKIASVQKDTLKVEVNSRSDYLLYYRDNLAMFIVHKQYPAKCIFHVKFCLKNSSALSSTVGIHCAFGC